MSDGQRSTPQWKKDVQDVLTWLFFAALTVAYIIGGIKGSPE